MSDVVWVALIVFAGQMITLWRQEAIKKDVADVKKHTNSLVERAVADADTIGHGRGVAEERERGASLAAEAAVEVAVVAAGVRETEQRR